ncbi:hypothetical protein G4V62_11330 [Bacillaceae bacterium SIJ1]|uniref:hypothetical protein n=1 Tax=Litoribacterium kuwaitense TaxID=1398745 RepID=UPI0013EAC362|nr:hypothetical protein [Litoribacterium kuwaitense]NGP45519.1 hypothetical protein [Litoribacterium kuwaitense]
MTTEDLELEISYDNWNHEEAIENPWKFHVDVSQRQLLSDRQVFDVHQTVSLQDGNAVTIDKVVTTPISTTVYYDLSESKTEDVHVQIQSKDGSKMIFSSAYRSNDPCNLLHTF